MYSSGYTGGTILLISNAYKLNWTGGRGSCAGVLPAQPCQQTTISLSTAAAYVLLTSNMQVLLDPTTSTGRGMNNSCGNNNTSRRTVTNAAAGSSTLPTDGVVVRSPRWQLPQ